MVNMFIQIFNNILAQKLRNCLITRQKYQKICRISCPDQDRVFSASDRNVQTLRLQALYGNGRLANTDMSASFQLIKVSSTLLGHHLQNPDYFDPENIIQLAIEGGCNAVATTDGVWYGGS